jgi:hypothetical protein
MRLSDSLDACSWQMLPMLPPDAFTGCARLIRHLSSLDGFSAGRTRRMCSLSPHAAFSRWTLSLDALGGCTRLIRSPDSLARSTSWTCSLIHALDSLAGITRQILPGFSRCILSYLVAGLPRWILSPNASAVFRSLLSLTCLADFSRCFLSLDFLAGSLRWLLSPDSIPIFYRRIFHPVSPAGHCRWMRLLSSLAG